MTFDAEFKSLDRVLEPWCQARLIDLYKKYRDDPVRLICLVDDAGNVYQIWFEMVDVNSVEISAWDMKNKKINQKSHLDNLEKNLENVFAKIREWMGNNAPSVEKPPFSPIKAG